MSSSILLQSVAFGLMGLALLNPEGLAPAQAQSTTIVLPRESSWAENLAAREARRYVYLRTGRLLPLVYETERSLPRGALIVVARKNRDILTGLPEAAAAVRSLEPQGYLLKTLERNATSGRAGKWQKRDVLLMVGGDDTGTLYGSYRLAEVLGARFYLHDDVLPDEPMKWRLPVFDQETK